MIGFLLNIGLQNMSNNVDLRPVPIPGYQSLLLPLLQIAGDRQEHTLAPWREQLARHLNLSVEDLAERLSSGQPVLSNRVAWAVQYLKAAVLVLPVKRSVYQITERGLALLSEQPVRLTTKDLRRYPEFVQFEGRRTSGEEASPWEAVAEAAETPDESLEASFQRHKERLASELLEAIGNSTPAAFEKLVVDLLVSMGYGGAREGAGKVVGRSGDGGIDGVIQEDRLGLNSIYVQAKRWKDVVGSPEIMKFSGGLTKKHATRGVFITSSDFTRDALDYVEALPQKIVLINGKRLAALMIENNVGVVKDQTYTLKQLNPAYFDCL